MGISPKRTPATSIASAQPALFDLDDVLPPGLRFQPAFISADEESGLIALAASLPLASAQYHRYTARRRVHAVDAQALPKPLQRLRDRLAGFAGVEPAAFAHALVTEYQPGTPLGWHRDAPMFEVVCGVSLGGPARLRLRPWPPRGRDSDRVVELDLAPRSAYLMQGPARWGWQHSVPPVPALRYSVTMRTARAV